MVKNRHSAGFAHIFLLAGLLVVVVLVAAVAFRVVRDTRQHNAAVQKERALYAKLDGEAQSYIQAINQKYPGKVTHTRSCNYASAEGYRGSLSCSVTSSIYYPSESTSSYDRVTKYADSQQKLLTWGNGQYDHETDALGKDTIQNVMYQQGQNVGCAITYYGDETYLEVSVDCGGNALAEYYPVVNK